MRDALRFKRAYLFHQMRSLASDLYGCHTILLTRWLEIVRTSLVALLHPPSSYKVLITHLLHATRNQLLTSALLSAAGHLIIGCRVCSISAVVP